MDNLGLRWVAEKKWYSEAADFEVSAAQGIKEGGVGRGAEGARDVSGERGCREPSLS